MFCRNFVLFRSCDYFFFACLDSDKRRGRFLPFFLYKNYIVHLSSYLSCNILFVLYYELINYSRLTSYTNNMDKQYDNKISNLF